KRFFFPGFTSDTGGLLREPELLNMRETWLSQPLLRWQLLQDLGISAQNIETLQQGACQVLLFCYPHAPVRHLLEQLAATREQSVVLVPKGVQAVIPP